MILKPFEEVMWEMRRARRIYEMSFPPEEQRPWSDIVLPKSPRGPHGYIVYGNNGLAGLVTTWDLDRWTYVEHLAVNPPFRGQGIGEGVLTELKRLSDKPIVLEVEPPADGNPMAARRIGFYRRNGFSVLDYDYIQPPYSPGLPPVPLLLMSTKADDNPGAIAKALHTIVYGVRE